MAARARLIQQVTPRKLPDAGRKAWLQDERDKVFEAARALGTWQHALIRWTYDTASRITETLHARWEDIDRREKTVQVVRLKGSKTEQPLPLSDALLDALHALEPMRPRQKGLIFVGHTRCNDRSGRSHKYKIASDRCPGGHLSQRYAHRWFAQACTGASLHPGLCHPHAAKHARLYDLAEELKAAGVPDYEVLDRLRRISGHVSYNSLLIYLTSRRREIEIMADLRRGLNKKGRV